MMSKINKIIAGGAFCFAAICSSVIDVSAYSSIYFDASLDTRNYQVVVDIYGEDEPGEYRKEDEYIKESSKNRGYTSGSAWSKKFNPKDSKGLYVANDINIFEKWAKDPGRFIKTKTPGSKKLTVPAMKLHKEGNESSVSNVRADSQLAMVLKDAVIAEEREKSNNLSMVNGLNKILSRIETLKGGYNDADDFRATLMALGYLFSGDAGGKVVIGVEESGEGIEKDKEEKNDEKLESSDEDYEGNGKNIIVEMSGRGDIVKTITIKQEGAEGDILLQHNMLIKADTGYRMINGRESSPGAKTVRITRGKDTYVNSNKLHGVIEPDDIAYVHLTNIIAHALIKYEAGITTTNSGGSMGWFEKLIFQGIDNVLTLIETGLGMVAIEDLIYNAASLDGSTDSRSEYVLGMYPKNWEPLITIVCVFVAIISVSVLVFSVLRIFYRMTLDSMNVGKRMELKEDIAGILQTVLTMIIFVFMFKVVGYVNYVLVTAIYEGLGGGSIILMGTNELGSSFIANVILRLVLVVVKVHLNIVYVIRALNLSLLLALSPAFITAIAFGKKDLFAKYVQEILGNIFLQSFHALFFLFIFEAQSYLDPGQGSETFTSMFTSVVLTFAVMPTTKMFKLLIMPSTLMSVGEDLGNKAGNKIGGTAKKYSDKARKSAWNRAKKAGGDVMDNIRTGKHKNTLEAASNSEEALSSLSQNENGKRIFKDLAEKTNDFTDESTLSEELKNLDEDQRSSLKDYTEHASNLSNMKNSLEKARKLEKRALADKSSLKRAKGLIKIDKDRVDMNAKFEQISGNGRYNSDVFNRAQKLVNQNAPVAGVIADNSIGGAAEKGYNIDQSFAKNMNFDSINTFDGNREKVYGNGFKMIGASDCIDTTKLPSFEQMEAIGPEATNLRQSIQCMQEAKEQVKGYQTSMRNATSGAEKEKYKKRINATIDRANATLKRYGVEQRGFLEVDNDGNFKKVKDATLEVTCANGRLVQGGPSENGVRIGYARNLRAKNTGCDR